MTSRRVLRLVGVTIFVLLNLAIVARPSSAGWTESVCMAGPDGKTVGCCKWCIFCLTCDLDDVVEVDG